MLFNDLIIYKKGVTCPRTVLHISKTRYIDT